MPVDKVWPILAVPVIAVIALGTGKISRNGARAGTGIGVLIALGSGWAGLAMVGSLLFFGSLVTHRSEPGRGAVQVFCNAGVATFGALSVLFGFDWGWMVLAGGLSTALSDTLSSELGKRWGGRPRLMLFGPYLQTGMDGGMSVVGTAVGVAGALIVPLAGALFGADWPLPTIGLIALAGLFGNGIDSLCGWLLQPRLGVLGNDWTNLLATASGAMLAVLLTP